MNNNDPEILEICWSSSNPGRDVKCLIKHLTSLHFILHFFTQMFSTRLTLLISFCFLGNNGQLRYHHLVLSTDKSHFLKTTLILTKIPWIWHFQNDELYKGQLVFDCDVCQQTIFRLVLNCTSTSRNYSCMNMKLTLLHKRGNNSSIF